MEQELNLDLTLLMPSISTEPPGFFLCSYCHRKFHTSQALGGHQNGHKHERSLTKQKLEFTAAMRVGQTTTAGAQDAAGSPGGDGVVFAAGNRARMDSKRAAPAASALQSNMKWISDDRIEVPTSWTCP